MALLMDVKSRVHPWIRLNRVIRDIPSQYIFGGADTPNMREDVLAEMKCGYGYPPALRHNHQPLPIQAHVIWARGRQAL